MAVTKRQPRATLRPTMTRAPKYSLERFRLIADHVREGLPLKHCAHAAGISDTTLHNWLAKAAAGIEPFTELALMMKQASLQRDGKLLKRVDKMSEKGSFQATKWLLENTSSFAGLQPQPAALSKSVKPEVIDAILLEEDTDDT